MNNAIFVFDYPENEPVKSYSPGTSDRKALQKELDRISSEVIDIPLIIGGKEVRTGNTEPVIMPHDHAHVLANYHKAGPEEVKMAIDAALKAHQEWESFSYVERVSVTLELLNLLLKNTELRSTQQPCSVKVKMPIRLKLILPAKPLIFLDLTLTIFLTFTMNSHIQILALSIG